MDMSAYERRYAWMRSLGRVDEGAGYDEASREEEAQVRARTAGVRTQPGHLTPPHLEQLYLRMADDAKQR